MRTIKFAAVSDDVKTQVWKSACQSKRTKVKEGC
jgi:hypothetical protein